MGVRKKKRDFFVTQSEQQINRGLYDLLKMATDDYNQYVIGSGMSYKRFVDFFVCLHQEVDGDYAMRNAHGYIVKVVSEIMSKNGEWAIDHFLTRDFTPDDVEKMLKAYHRGEKLPTSPLPPESAASSELSSFTLNYHLTKEQIGHIVAISREHHLFDVDELTTEHILNLLDCKPHFKIRLGFERGFCFLFARLAWNGHLHSRWQSIMEKGEFLMKAEGDGTLKAKTLSSTCFKSQYSNSDDMVAVRNAVNTFFPAISGNGNNRKV